MDDNVLGKWTKGNGNIVQLILCRFKGQLRLDFREYFRDGDKWKPTKKGINLPAQAAHKISKCTDRAITLIRRRRKKNRK